MLLVLIYSVSQLLDWQVVTYTTYSVLRVISLFTPIKAVHQIELPDKVDPYILFLIKYFQK